MADKPPAIVFHAIVYKVQTVVTDNGIRVTFDLPETEIAQMAALAECRRQEIALVVTVKADKTV